MQDDEIDDRERYKRETKDEEKEKEKYLGRGKAIEGSELKKTKMGILACLH